MQPSWDGHLEARAWVSNYKKLVAGVGSCTDQFLSPFWIVSYKILYDLDVYL